MSSYFPLFIMRLAQGTAEAVMPASIEAVERK